LWSCQAAGDWPEEVAAVAREELDAEKIDRTSTASQLATIVRGRILSGTFAPGTPIREVALAESLGVSRNTVREGVRLLLGEGLLEHRPHKGIAVATVDTQDIQEIYAARRLLELKAIRTGKKEALAEGVPALNVAIEQMESGTQTRDLNAIRDADASFHRAIVQLLRNERLVSFESTLLGELRLGLAYLDRSDAEYQTNWMDEHRRIARAIKKGDRAEAARLLSTHLDVGESRLLEVVWPRSEHPLPT
jgi:DNA-binding GntR family transcriptional regulator